MKTCANLSLLFPEAGGLLERIDAAGKAGFSAVEVQFPYDDPANEILSRMAKYDMQLITMNCPPPNYTGGERGWAAVPALQDRFRRDFARALRFAKALGVTRMHIMSGSAEGAEARQTYVGNLRWAAEQAPHMSLLIEPINQTSMPGYFLSDYDEAVRILDELAAPNLSLLFDSFHAAMIEGDIVKVWDRIGQRVTHVQVGGAPHRHEPENHDAFFDRLRADGYGGYVSGEYNPRGLTTDGLSWVKAAT